MIVLCADDFANHEVWRGIVEQAKTMGMIPAGSYDEGETNVDPEQIMITVDIREVS